MKFSGWLSGVLLLATVSTVVNAGWGPGGWHRSPAQWQGAPIRFGMMSPPAQRWVGPGMRRVFTGPAGGQKARPYSRPAWTYVAPASRRQAAPDPRWHPAAPAGPMARANDPRFWARPASLGRVAARSAPWSPRLAHVPTRSAATLRLNRRGLPTGNKVASVPRWAYPPIPVRTAMRAPFGKPSVPFMAQRRLIPAGSASPLAQYANSANRGGMVLPGLNRPARLQPARWNSRVMAPQPWPVGRPLMPVPHRVRVSMWRYPPVHGQAFPRAMAYQPIWRHADGLAHGEAAGSRSRWVLRGS